MALPYNTIIVMGNKDNSKGPYLQPVEKGKRLIGLKDSAYKDYVAARILFLNVQLHRAAFFANTCIEKELKACLSTLGKDCAGHHDSFKLLHLLKERDEKTFNKINPDFVKVLSKIYQSRYHEGLNPGYNFVIVKRKFLAELDFTYSVLEHKVRYKINSVPGDITKSRYEIEVENKSQTIVLENYLYTGVSKREYLESPDDVFEFRMFFNHEVMDASYSIPKNNDLDKFIYQGLTPVHGSKSQFIISNNQPGLTNLILTRNGILQFQRHE